MSIPNFKSNHDWEAFTSIFDSQWHCKRALLNRVKDDMFPGYNKANAKNKQCDTHTIDG